MRPTDREPNRRHGPGIPKARVVGKVSVDRTASVPMDHAAIRRRMLDRRRALSTEAVAHASALVVERVRILPACSEAGLIAGYMGRDGEIDPSELRHGLNPEVALPVVRAEQPLQFVIPDGPLKLGPFGIQQPTTGRVVHPTDLEAVLVPLVA